MANQNKALHILAFITAKDGCAEGFIKSFKPLSDATHTEPGCLRYDLVRSHEDPNQFVVIEEYRDEAAFNAHTGSPHFAQFRAEAAKAGYVNSTVIKKYSYIDPSASASIAVATAAW